MTKRWNRHAQTKVENLRVDMFIKAIENICRHHGLSISHEDAQGAFIIENLDQINLDWINEAVDGTMYMGDSDD